ncbi:hypothetical protein HID58_088866 [Brassica napus]|uniref:Uncharacterized protein n=1 Tax=Brassica napus TaxID=3708 RepID=A0ABQ7XXC4_BRANA|nr:hypothetical protein HID58_088866 [Brassica napus]
MLKLDGSKFNRTKWGVAAFSRVSLGIIRFRGRPSKFFYGQLIATQHSISRTPISRTPRPHHHHSDLHPTTLSVYIVCDGPSWLNQLIQEEEAVYIAPD